MKTRFRHLSVLVLSAALLAPAGFTTRAASQDDRRQEDKRQQDTQRNDRNQTRVYDRTHKDYHDWNEKTKIAPTASTRGKISRSFVNTTS